MTSMRQYAEVTERLIAMIVTQLTLELRILRRVIVQLLLMQLLF